MRMGVVVALRKAKPKSLGDYGREVNQLLAMVNSGGPRPRPAA